MKYTDIYQTLEDRQNDEYIKKNGPFFCSARCPDGRLKTGIKAPWLGEGFYFWDTRIEDAQWWGDTIYERRGYVICHTKYDQHSPLLYDLVGDVRQFDEFVKCAKFIQEQRNLSYITFPAVLAFLKKSSDFNFKAIRVWPYPKNMETTTIQFPRNSSGKTAVLAKNDKIQICFFDKTLLTEPYQIVQKKTFAANQTI